ncbi:unnamed protein product, partial [Rotaria socialis]
MNPRCRKCLDNWEFNHRCQKSILCAQCEGPHLSTSIECPVVYNYRITLKDQVKNAINDGLISQPSINQKREANRYVEDERFETKQINGTKQAWGRQSKPTERPQIQHENENDRLGELVCRTKDVLDIIRRMELKMDNQVVKVDILEKRSVLNKEKVFKENVSEKFNAIANDHQQQTPTSPSLEPNEKTVIVDAEGLTEQIRIIGIYWPQCQSRNLEDLTSCITEKTILTGDFNASAQEWQSPVTDARGNQLKKWIEKNNLLFIPGTKNSSKRSDRHIDRIFTNIEDVEAETLNTGTSDHWPIVMKSDRIGFQTDGNRPSLPPYIVGILKQVRRVRNKYYRERKTNFGVEVERTRLLLRTLTKQVKNEVYNYKSERWNAFLSTIQESHDRNGKHFWSHLSKIYKPKTLPISKLKAGSITIADQQEMTNMLSSYYKEQANSPTIDESEKRDQKIVRDYNKIMNTLSKPLDIKVEKVASSEVTKIIKKLKNKKSSGYDQISNYIIKLLPPAYIDCLVKCFNVWLSEGRYPDFWKLAKIITLNKLNAGVPRPDQTRPISLLATHSKLFEKVLLERVNTWAEGAQLVPIEQSGFRQGGLIATRVLSIYQEIQNNLAENMPTLALYVDYRKAYDM